LNQPVVLILWSLLETAARRSSWVDAAKAAGVIDPIVRDGDREGETFVLSLQRCLKNIEMCIKK